MKYTKKELSGNIWKIFVYSLTQRRHFIPLLSIFFLTLPNTHANQIGIYTAVGFLFSFLFEIPSSYFADKIGHKKVLVLSKIFMVLSMASFIFANSFIYFVFGSIFLSLSTTFTLGTKSAFMHNTLIALKRDKDYTKIMSKIGANASIISMVLIILLPFFTKISILLPFMINMIFDIIGLIIALTLKSPPQKFEIEETDKKSFWHAVKTSSAPYFYPTAIFVGAISGFMLADSGYRYVYLDSLGYPIVLIGLVMGISRIIWFLIGHNIHFLEKIGIKKLFLMELFLFPTFFFLVSYFSNPYLVGFIFSLFVGYYWGRSQLIINYFLNSLITNKNYKATMLSIQTQIQLVFQVIVAFGIGFIMKSSYKLGFFVMGVLLFLVLVSSYPHLDKSVDSNIY